MRLLISVAKLPSLPNWLPRYSNTGTQVAGCYATIMRIGALLLLWALPPLTAAATASQAAQSQPPSGTVSSWGCRQVVCQPLEQRPHSSIVSAGDSLLQGWHLRLLEKKGAKMGGGKFMGGVLVR